MKYILLIIIVYFFIKTIKVKLIKKSEDDKVIDVEYEEVE